jgi:O-acetyl-ADP-ribose deacetylase (regulator of RNase III)
VPELAAARGDITTFAVDAIVNAANSSLLGGGDVAQLVAACRLLGGCATGDAKTTPGFGLPARHVIHTVGPVWRGGDHGESDLLAACYRRSLEEADAVAARTLAFPAISTGIYGYPVEAAAEVAVTTVRACSTGVAVVTFVAFDAATLHAYTRLLPG